MSDITFSVLVPSIPSRFGSLRHIVGKLVDQAAERDDVEVLVWMDNKRRSIGRKRDDLVQAAQGEYLAFVDDDDDVPDDYVESAAEWIATHPGTDVFTTDQQCFYNGEPFLVTFRLGDGDQPMERLADGHWSDLVREPMHCCIWRAELAKSVRFPDVGYFEDSGWAKKARALVETTVHIPKVLHVYRYDDLVSEGHDWEG